MTGSIGCFVVETAAANRRCDAREHVVEADTALVSASFAGALTAA